MSMTNINIGSGATIGIGSDCYAATVVAVSASGRVVTVQGDHAVPTNLNGPSEYQTYEYAQNPSGRVQKFSLRKNGRWALVGTKGACYRLHIGSRRSYRDPSF
jgi:hypothetical protein